MYVFSSIYFEADIFLYWVNENDINENPTGGSAAKLKFWHAFETTRCRCSGRCLIDEPINLKKVEKLQGYTFDIYQCLDGQKSHESNDIARRNKRVWPENCPEWEWLDLKDKQWRDASKGDWEGTEITEIQETNWGLKKERWGEWGNKVMGLKEFAGLHPSKEFPLRAQDPRQQDREPYNCHCSRCRLASWFSQKSLGQEVRSAAGLGKEATENKGPVSCWRWIEAANPMTSLVPLI